MKFLVDAQLPRRLVLLLRQADHDAIHTLDLPNANQTTDTEINALAERDQRIVITKDADFVNSFRVLGKPRKLLLVSTGNITNTDLLALFSTYLPDLTQELQIHDYVELRRTTLIIHL
jgi:predicted nuclease of predicted toxin-antitoxin system